MKRFAASDTDCAANSATLKALAGEIAAQHLSDLFATDTQRFHLFSRRLGPLLLDFSKQRINDRIFSELLAQADCAGLKGWIDRLFAGEPVNCTEQRAAMHWLLREPDSELLSAELSAVHEQLARMATLVEQVHAGQWRGYAGDAITDVVNIGVGGSELGPLMACRALEDAVVPEARHLNIHYASTMDGSQVSHLLRQLKPHTTLFVISSKSFTTVDTLYNANTARAWLQRAFGDDPAVYRCHFLAVSARPDLMSEWGIPAQNQLQIWDWVGGRFSVWSAVGLAVALKVGMAGFCQLLAGAHQMDTHFRSTPWHDNIPVIMALLGIWNTNYLGISAQAILPYDGRLKYLPAYLTQLEMESNGKSVRRDGSAVAGHTCPVVWGDVGPNAQHAFYQLLHQGTQPVTCDFIVAARRYHDGGQRQATPTLVDQHRLALANCLAQSRLLALGEASINEQAQLPGYKRYHGNQPSTTLLLDTLTPHTLGMLVAAYEHKVFAQAVLWGINPFDQWGVEMGKRSATDMLALLQGEEAETVLDSSTAGLIDSARAGND